MPEPSIDHDLPGWAMKVIMRGSVVYAAASTLASSIALGHLAWEAGYHDPRAVLFGAAFEVACVITGTAWAAAHAGSWWHQVGKRTTIGLIGASLLFNGAEVLQVRDLLPPGVLLAVAVAVSFVFPLLALMFGHLGLVARREQSARTTPDRPAREVVPAPVIVTVPAPAVVAVPDVVDEDVDDVPARVDLRKVVPPAAVPDPAAGADPLDQAPGDVDDEQPPDDDAGDPDLDGLDPLVLQVAEFIRVAQRDGNHHGERTIAREFRVPRKRAGELIRAAKALPVPTPATNGTRVPLPTAGA